MANSGVIPSVEQWQHYFDIRIDELLGKLRIWSTQRVENRLSADDAPTEQTLKPQIYTGSTITDVFQVFYRLLFEQKFTNRNLNSKDLEILSSATASDLRALLSSMEQLFELGRFGKIYCDQTRIALDNNNVSAAKTASSRLQEVDQLIYSVGNQAVPLAPLAYLHQRRQELLPALDIKQMAENIKYLYQDLQDSALVLLDLSQSLFHTTYQNEISQSIATTEEDPAHV